MTSNNEGPAGRPGKFEHCVPVAASLWADALEGCYDEQTIEDGITVYYFVMGPSDHTRWNVTEGQRLRLWEDDQGFVRYAWL